MKSNHWHFRTVCVRVCRCFWSNYLYTQELSTSGYYTRAFWGLSIITG